MALLRDRSRRDRVLVAVGLVLLTAAVAVLAVADHRWKQRRIDRAQIAMWYCVHRGVHCGGALPDKIEDAWNRRQLAYEIAAVASMSLAFVVAVSAIRPRRL